MNLINPYFPNAEIRNFPNLEKELEQHYDYFVKDERPFKKISPRGAYELKIGFKEIYYYISWLYDNDPKKVIDLGAGECFWKRWFPNITSLEPGGYESGEHADFHMNFSEKFADDHLEEYDCGMALNSLHFGKINSVKYLVEQAMRLIKPKGRFLFTISSNVIQKQYLNKENDEYWVNLISDMFFNMPHKVILFDCPWLREGYEFDTLGNVNGTLRFILEK